MQRYRGLDPRTRVARWGLLAVALGIVFGGSLPAAASVVSALAPDQLATLPWFLSRLLAILAYLAFTGSVVYGLLLSTGILDAIAHRPISFALHQDLSAIGVGFAAVHGALLLLDRTIHFSVLDVIVPFASPYRPVWVGAGQVALLLAAVVVASFYVRRRIGQQAWRRLHVVTFASFAAATAHGIMSGTDSASPWAWWLYVGSVAIVAFLTTVRIVLARAGGRRAAAASPAPGRVVAHLARSDEAA